MINVKHPSTNAVLGKPPEMTEEQCSSLMVTRAEMDNIPCVISYWKPSDKEMLLLAQGEPIRICILGVTQPPIAVGVSTDGEMGLL